MVVFMLLSIVVPIGEVITMPKFEGCTAQPGVTEWMFIDGGMGFVFGVLISCLMIALWVPSKDMRQREVSVRFPALFILSTVSLYLNFAWLVVGSIVLWGTCIQAIMPHLYLTIVVMGLRLLVTCTSLCFLLSLDL